MAWDASRPVPWRKLVGLFAIYAVVALVVFSLTGGLDVGALIGLVVGGLMYAGLAAALVKFGWDPFTRASDRAEARAKAKAQQRATKTASAAGGTGTQFAPVHEGPRPRPAPTRRTSVGPATASPTKKRPLKRR